MCLAIPALIVSVADAADPWLRTGSVDFGGIVRTVNLACTPEAAVGQYVLVHVGIAISILAPEEAWRIRTYLEEIEKNQQPPAPGHPADVDA
jgi:hydrogenase expression/formation protein HypC